MKETSKCIKE